MKKMETFARIFKGCSLLLVLPLAIVVGMLALMFYAWPLFCIGLIVVAAVSFLSTTVAWVLFSLMLAFVLIVVIAKIL